MLVLVDVRVLVDVLVLVLINVVVVGGVITNSTFVSHSATAMRICDHSFHFASTVVGVTVCQSKLVSTFQVYLLLL